MESRWLELGGPVHVADFGGQGVPIVLIHGLDGSYLNWTRAAPLLTRSGHVLAPDLLGFGLTPPFVRPTVANDVTMIRRLLDVTGPAILVGSSLGGFIAMRVAAEYPDHVHALVLVAPAEPGIPEHRRTAARFALEATPLLGPLFRRLRAAWLGPRRLVEKNLIEPCVADPRRLPREVIEEQVALETLRLEMPWRHRTSSLGLRGVFATTLAPQAHDRLVDAIRCRVLVVHGTEDQVMHLEVSQALARRPGWDLEVIEGVGHVPHLEMPERFARAVESWLGTLVPATVA